MAAACPSPARHQQDSPPFRFLHLPPEIREQVYHEILCDAKNRYQPDPELPPHFHFSLGILLANRQIHQEAKKIFLDNVFVKISMPWPKVMIHFEDIGKVAVVTRGEYAREFQNYHLDVIIDTAEGSPAEDNRASIITNLEGLEAFTQMWHCWALEYPAALWEGEMSVNPRMKLDLIVNDPHSPPRPLPGKLQARLLLPFGKVKNLQSLSISASKGLPPPHASIVELVEKARAIPDPTLEECIDKALALKDQGNELVVAKLYREGMDRYIQAFAAIHIFVHGRSRSVHCDGFYARVLRSGRFEDCEGHYARLMLRIKLVANIVFTYLKLEEWEEAYFWGKRTLVLFLQSMSNFGDREDIGGDGWDDLIQDALSMPIGPRDDMGKMFYRTAVAAKMIGKQVDARFWMIGAAKFLPLDDVVRKEFEAMDGDATNKGEESKATREM